MESVRRTSLPYIAPMPRPRILSAMAGEPKWASRPGAGRQRREGRMTTESPAPWCQVLRLRATTGLLWGLFAAKRPRAAL